MAGKYKIVCDQGSTLRRTLLIATQGATPTPWPLAGYDARMQVRETVASTAVVLELTVIDGRLQITGVPGQILMVVSATDTAALVAGSYVYDLEVQSPTGIVTRLLQGSFVVTAEVTR